MNKKTTIHRLLFAVSLSMYCSTQTLAQITAEITNASNVNANDGSIVLSVQGGMPPYSYEWNYGSQNTNQLLNLNPGTYCVTVTDVFGCCSLEECYTVESDCPILILGIQYSKICRDNDGSLYVVLENDGVPPYEFQWSNGLTTQGIGNLSTGMYCVTVSDQSNCQSTMCYNLVNKVLLSGSVVNACAGENNGSIDLSVGGDPGPYTYAWSNGATNQDPNNLNIGSYCVTVTSSSGCTNSQCFEVANKIKLSANVYDDCTLAGNGKIDLTVEGAVYPEFQWSNSFYGATTEDIENIDNSPFPYCVTVTSQDGCTNSACYFVYSYHVTASINPACFGQNTGMIDLSCRGVPPISYVWSNGATTEDVDQLAGNKYYYCTVTDSRGCVDEGEYPVPELFHNFEGIIKNYCGESHLGSITLSKIPNNCTFLWSNGATTKYISNLNVGTYCVTATAPGGCTISKCFFVNDGLSSSGIYTEILSNVSSCSRINNEFEWDACDGAISIGIDIYRIRADGPFTFEWAGPNGFAATGHSITNLCTGTYTVTVTNAQGCSTNKVYYICCCYEDIVPGQRHLSTCVSNGPPTDLNINNSQTVVIAPNQDNYYKGRINVVVDGGYPGQSLYYTWTYPNGAIGYGKEITGLPTGIYCVTVSNGCSSVNKCFNLGFCSPLDNSIPSINLSALPTCEGGHSGEIRIEMSGGTSPYSLNWNGGSAVNLNTFYTIRSLEEGTYTITITDSKYCTATATGLIEISQTNGFRFPLQGVDGFQANDPCYHFFWEDTNIEVLTNCTYFNAPTSGYPYHLTIEWPDLSNSTFRINAYDDCEVLGNDNYDPPSDGVFVCAMIDQFGCRKEWCFEFGDETELVYPYLNSILPPGGEINPINAYTGCIKCQNCGSGNCPGSIALGCNPNSYNKFVYTPNSMTNPCGAGGVITIPCDNTNITLQPSFGIEFVDWENGIGVAEGICEYPIGCLFLGLSDPFFQGGPVYVETKIRIANPNCHSPVQTNGNQYLECPQGVRYTFSEDQDCWGTVICASTGLVLYEGILEEFTKICYIEKTEAMCDKVKICTMTNPYTILQVVDSDVPCPNDCSQLCVPCIALISGPEDRSNEVKNVLQLKKSEEIRAFPNPFDQELIIEYSSPIEKGAVQVFVFDVLGDIKIETSTFIKEGLNLLTLTAGDEIQSGIFYVIIKDKKGFTAAVKAVRLAK